MSNESRSSSYTATLQDISRLKQTATDAVNDMSGSPSTDGTGNKSQLRELVGRFQEEGSEHLQEITGKLSDLTNTTRIYISKRPLFCVGAALTIGFLIGLGRRRSRD